MARSEGILAYAGRAVARLRTKGLANTLAYGLHVLREYAVSAAIDLKYGGKVCRTDLDINLSRQDCHTMVHSHYHVLRDVFAQLRISPDDVLVDIGCGEGRVINFWLSRGLKNRMIGIEIDEAVARRTRRRYRKYPNVSIIHGDAIASLPAEGTVFYLYNPFSAETVARFEAAVRDLGATIVYHNNNYMAPFQRDPWIVQPIRSARRIYEFSAAIITGRQGGVSPC